MTSSTGSRVLGLLLAGVGAAACAAPSAPPPSPSLPRAASNRAPVTAAPAAARTAAAPGESQSKVPPATDLAADGEAVERVRVPLGGPSRGSESAKVNLVVFADFECPFSRRIQPTLARLMTDYAGDLRIFYRHDPMPFHPRAPLAAEAAVAAGAQGKFWAMHDRIYDGQASLERANLESYAQEVGLDLGKFQAALDSHAGKGVVQADAELAAKIHVPGTPTSFANGRVIRGAVSYDDFKRVIDEEVARADALLARDRKSTRLNSSHALLSRMPSSA